MSASELSKRYSKALMALVKEGGKVESAVAELKLAGHLFSDEAVVGFFRNPSVSPDAKRATIAKAFEGKGISASVANLVGLLAEKNRIALIPEIYTAFQELLDQEGGLTRGIVKSATPLSEAAKKALEEKIGTVLKMKIVLTAKEDSSVVGGAVAQVGGWTFDDSLASQMNKLNEELNRRAE